MTKKKNVSKGKKQNLSKKKKNRLKILKWTSLCVLSVGGITLFLLSDIFNIKEIKVTNNSKISAQEIRDLSTIKVNENMFKFFKLSVEEKIKQNPYIETVDVDRNLNGIIEIEVTERVATYMLLLENQYVYINNQGYILEISDIKLELPVITGYVTESLEAGKRLEEEDLKKLDTIIQIIKTSKEKGLENQIINIDMSDEKDFLLTFENENKLVHFGDSSNINDKFIMLKAVLADNVGQKGEIFVKDLNKVFFRENFREEGV